MKFIILLSVFFTVLLQCTSGLKMLFIVPMASRSHFIVGSSIAKALSAAGHDISMISSNPLKSKVKNYRDIELTGLDEIYEG